MEDSSPSVKNSIRLRSIGSLRLTGADSVAGPVRRALHVDPANVFREQ
jgi:hypothetical protein